MKPMTVGSLFAGIGGFDLGFERAGFKTIWQVEIDDYCRRGGEDVAHSIRVRQPGPRVFIHPGNQAAHGEGETSDALHVRFRSQWETEPNVGRVAHGIPARVDRLKSLGNAVVPQIAEWLATRILAAEEGRNG